MVKMKRDGNGGTVFHFEHMEPMKIGISIGIPALILLILNCASIVYNVGIKEHEFRAAIQQNKECTEELKVSVQKHTEELIDVVEDVHNNDRRFRYLIRLAESIARQTGADIPDMDPDDF